MIYLYLFGTCFHFIYVFMIIGNIREEEVFIYSFIRFCIPRIHISKEKLYLCYVN